MNVCPRRWVLISVFALVTALGCSPTATSPSPSSPPTTPPSAATSSMPTGGSAPEYAALEAEIEKAISTGPATLDSVRAVLVSVDGETKIAHYRHGFTGNDYGHVFSVTKSVLSILIGIALAEGLIDDIDRPLIELLPKHREAMGGDRDATKVTLRHLMTMSGGFNEFPGGFVWQEAAKPGNSFIDVLLKRRQVLEPGKVFWYSDASAHLVSAVLAAALERADGDRPRTVLDYAREKLFDPLGISTHPSYSGPLPDPLLTPDFVTADFGWGTDPNGIELGGFGLRLTPPDMVKIGELYRLGGLWNGQQIVPSGMDPTVHHTGYIRNQSRRHNRPRLRTVLVDHHEAQAGWIPRPRIRRATDRRTAEFASSDRLSVGRAIGQLHRRKGSGTPRQGVGRGFPTMTAGIARAGAPRTGRRPRPRSTPSPLPMAAIVCPASP